MLLEDDGHNGATNHIRSRQVDLDILVICISEVELFSRRDTDVCLCLLCVESGVLKQLVIYLDRAIPNSMAYIDILGYVSILGEPSELGHVWARNQL